MHSPRTQDQEAVGFGRLPKQHACLMLPYGRISGSMRLQHGAAAALGIAAEQVEVLLFALAFGWYLAD